MMKFNIGDKVKILQSQFKELKVGSVREVVNRTEKLSPDYNVYFILDEDYPDIPFVFWERELELVPNLKRRIRIR